MHVQTNGTKILFFCFTSVEIRKSPLPLPRARCSMETPPPQPKKANSINSSIRHNINDRIMAYVCAHGSNRRYSITNSISQTAVVGCDDD